MAAVGFLNAVPEKELDEMSEAFAERKPGERKDGLDLCRESLTKDLLKHAKR